MKAIIDKYKLYLLAVLAVLAVGCSRKEHKVQIREELPHVLVIHSQGANIGSYRNRAVSVYKDAKNKAGLTDKIDLQHLMLPFPMADSSELYDSLCHDLKGLTDTGWKPDVVIVHGDVAMLTYESLLRESAQADRSLPLVYTGLMVTDSVAEREPLASMQVTGKRDSVCIEQNLQLFRRMWGETAVCNIELDYTWSTDAIRQKLYQAIEDTTKYENNSDFHIWNLTEDVLLNRPKGLPLLVNFISAASIRDNQPYSMEGTPEQVRKYIEARDNLRTIYHRASQLHTLSVWHNLFSNSIIDHALMPQLSITNVQFGDEYPLRNLGGYFCNMETEATDAMQMVASILNGTPADSIPRGVHTPGLYLDWRCMQRHGLKYDEWQEEAQIINAPYQEAHPIFFYILIMLASLLIGAVISAIALALLKIYFDKRYRIMTGRENNLAWMLTGDESGVWKVQDGEIQFITRTKTSIGTGTQEIKISKYLNMVHPEEREKVKDMLLNKSEGIYDIAFRVTYDGGATYQWMRSTLRVNTLRDGKTNTIGIAYNIQKEKEEEADMLRNVEASEETKMKEAFLANVSHDLRSPLSSIVSFASIITDPSIESTPEEKELYAQQIESNTKLMLNLLDDVMDMSKIQIGEYRFMNEAFSVRLLMEQIYGSYSVLVPHHLKFEFVPSEEVTLYLDPARVTQVINNFLSNAIKATKEGCIEMGWKVAEGMCHLYVKDTGCGIPADELPHLFEKYAKFDGNMEGAGLGLNICKNIVEAQGGTIKVESKEGEGSTFSAIWKIQGKGNKITS